MNQPTTQVEEWRPSRACGVVLAIGLVLNTAWRLAAFADLPGLQSLAFVPIPRAATAALTVAVAALSIAWYERLWAGRSRWPLASAAGLLLLSQVADRSAVKLAFELPLVALCLTHVRALSDYSRAIAAACASHAACRLIHAEMLALLGLATRIVAAYCAIVGVSFALHFLQEWYSPTDVALPYGTPSLVQLKMWWYGTMTIYTIVSAITLLLVPGWRCLVQVRNAGIRLRPTDGLGFAASLSLDTAGVPRDSILPTKASAMDAVYITSRGARFHRRTCHAAGSAMRAVERDSVPRHVTACRVCQPTAALPERR